MKNAIIVHGMPPKEEYYDPTAPSASNAHWIPWLSKQFLINDINAYAVEVPHCYSPVYELWKTEFEKNTVNADSILVGHSCGGGFLIRWLSENKQIKINKLVLVAPWLGHSITIPTNLKDSFFNFEWDENLAYRINNFYVLNSLNDMPDIHESVKEIHQKVKNIQIINFQDKGHFTEHDLGGTAFPELLEICLSK